MTPLDYVKNFCIIKRRRKKLYQDIFVKHKDKTGQIPFKVGSFLSESSPPYMYMQIPFIIYIYLYRSQWDRIYIKNAFIHQWYLALQGVIKHGWAQVWSLSLSYKRIKLYIWWKTPNMISPMFNARKAWYSCQLFAE